LKDYSMITPEALTQEAKKIARFHSRESLYAVLRLLSILTPLFFLLLGFISPPAFAVVFVLAVILSAWSLKWEFAADAAMEEREKEYDTAFKKLVVRQAAQELFRHYSFEPDKGLEEDEIPLREVLPYAYFAKSTNLLHGFYKGIAFRRANLKASVASTYENQYSTETLLTGQFIDFQNPLKFSSVLYIYTEDMFEEIEEKIRRSDGEVRAKYLFTTGDKAFDKSFRCLSHDSSEAREILTADCRNAVMKLAKSVGAPFVTGFTHDRVFLLIDTGIDHFEPPEYLGYIDKMNLEYETKRVSQTLKIVCDAIDMVKESGTEESSGTDVADELEAFWKKGTPAT